jgi:nucleoside-diphosphate-sugar epimerase
MSSIKKRDGRILIAGCGRIGSQLGLLLSKQGHTVWGLRRNPQFIPDELLPIRGNLASGEGLSSLPPAIDHVFFFTSSSDQTEDAYRAGYSEAVGKLIQALQEQSQEVKRFFFISSTGVFAQQRGEWVDERSPAEPTYAAGRYLLEGERRVTSCPYPGTIVRFAGIYGPERVRLVERVSQGREHFPTDRTQYTNLVHQDDCAFILDHLIHVPRPEPLYLAVDCQPVERSVLIKWIARQLGVSIPESVPSKSLPRRMLRSNKRCRNHLLLESGFRFTYPDFKSGYRPIIEELKRDSP